MCIPAFYCAFTAQFKFMNKVSLKVELLHIGYTGIIITLNQKPESIAFLLALCNRASLCTSVIFKNSSAPTTTFC